MNNPAPSFAWSRSAELTAISRSDKITWWDNVYGFDMSSIGRTALTEPLVDCVDAAQIATHACLLKSFDIKTMRKEDASFQAPFVLATTRKDYIHAIVAYFDIEFADGHKAITFSTGPRSRATHWKQTVFYLEDTLIVHPNETIKGTRERLKRGDVCWLCEWFDTPLWGRRDM